MSLPAVDKIWMDGELVDWDKAQVHVLTHALHYGSGVFEGVRCYSTVDGPAVFRLTEMVEATGMPKDDFCLACFDGEYPVEIPPSVKAGKLALEGCK